MELIKRIQVESLKLYLNEFDKALGETYYILDEQGNKIETDAEERESIINMTWEEVYDEMNKLIDEILSYDKEN